jgi:hypothetical protein
MPLVFVLSECPRERFDMFRHLLGHTVADLVCCRSNLSEAHTYAHIVSQGFDDDAIFDLIIRQQMRDGQPSSTIVLDDVLKSFDCPLLRYLAAYSADLHIDTYIGCRDIPKTLPGYIRSTVDRYIVLDAATHETHERLLDVAPLSKIRYHHV